MRNLKKQKWTSISIAVVLCMNVVGCGGGSSSTQSSINESGGSSSINVAIDTRVSTGALVIDGEVTHEVETIEAGALSQMSVQPFFHVGGVVNEPGSVDQVNPMASSKWSANVNWIPQEMDGIDSSQLTPSEIRGVLMGRSIVRRSGQGEVNPMAGGSAIATYTPAQIRAAYGLPALPTSWSGLTSQQAAQFGAGQTVYIIIAYNSPNMLAELNAFNQKFGLPQCVNKTVATNATLPLSPPSGNQCEISMVYSTPSGAMTSAVPGYNEGWATELALDVQWVHATAPLARIVVVASADPNINSIAGSIALANRMGPGVVSMSLGAREGSWVASLEGYFNGSGMTYVAATGDYGTEVNWPAVASKVVGVGGTTLTYTGGTRSESVWSGAGGGVSAFLATPTYQTSGIPGVGSLTKRGVSDVSFNADPASGQYTAVMSQGSTSVSWISAGGTSLAAPQWAGVFAITNALKKVGGKNVMTGSEAHTSLYNVAKTNYATDFKDITTGSNGSCSLCIGKSGYDLGSGLGSPNASVLMNRLSGSTSTTSTIDGTPPSIQTASISGKEKTALTFTANGSGVNGVTYAIAGAPAGMSINATTGVVTWSSPVFGVFKPTITVKDKLNNKTASAVYTVNIAGVAPTISAGVWSAEQGKSWSATIVSSSSNGVTYSATGMPSGASLNATTGVLTWSNPIAGSYGMTITVKDKGNGLSSSANYSLNVKAAAVINKITMSNQTVSATAGTSKSYTIVATKATTSSTVSYSMAGAPSGLSLNASTGVMTWSNPIAGTYNVAVTARDSNGTMATGTITWSVASSAGTTANNVTTVSGISIEAPNLSVTAGKAVVLPLSIKNANSTSGSVSVALTGVPLGMTWKVNSTRGSMMQLEGRWEAAVKGNYSINVKATWNGVVVNRVITLIVN